MFRFLFLRERKSYRTHISRHGEYYQTKHKLSPCLCFKILGKKSEECAFFFFNSSVRFISPKLVFD